MFLSWKHQLDDALCYCKYVEKLAAEIHPVNYTRKWQRRKILIVELDVIFAMEKFSVSLSSLLLMLFSVLSNMRFTATDSKESEDYRGNMDNIDHTCHMISLKQRMFPFRLVSKWIWMDFKLFVYSQFV